VRQAAKNVDFNDSLSYVWTLNSKVGSTKDHLTLLTNSESAGTYFVSAEVSDNANNAVSVVWKVVVEDVNRPPVLEKLPDISVKEGVEKWKDCLLFKP
jgi:hypothetical protein